MTDPTDSIDESDDELTPRLTALGPARPVHGLMPRRVLRGVLRGEVPDRLTDFFPPITLLRWGTLAVAIGLAVPDLASIDPAITGWGTALFLYTVLRTIRPLVDNGRLRDLVAVLADIAIHVSAVVATGYWSSPFALMAVNAIVVGGFARGFAFAFRLAVASALAVGIPQVGTAANTTVAMQNALAWSAVLVLVAIVSGYAVRLFGEAAIAREEVLGQMDQLAQANELLTALNRVAQTLPASLDEGHLVESTVSRMRSLVEARSVVILLRDPGREDWRVAAAEGVRLGTRLGTAGLPLAARYAINQVSSRLVDDAWQEQSGAFAPRARSAIYAPMAIRDEVIGLIGVEASIPGAFTPAEATWVEGVAGPTALAFANAQLFRRLRAVGAEEERTRIARDLHDRVGQSLAYLAFELDRLTGRAGEHPLSNDLNQLRGDVRKVVTEVRETLYDIRSDVTEEHGIVEVLGLFLDRVAERSGLEVAFRHRGDGERLPIPQEREMWRIAQEAVVNAERHAQASAVGVSWQCGADQALLIVFDDGRGFEPETASRLDSYGMIGMRERAQAIGAILEVETAPGKGTKVRCMLDRQ